MPGGEHTIPGRTPQRRRTPRGRAAVPQWTRRTVGSILLVLTGAGCASTTAPRDWLPGANEVGVFPYGAWVTVETRDDGKKELMHGELIAVSDTSVIILTDSQWVEIARTRTKKVKATVYSTDLVPLIAWSTVGTLSSISHGFGLLVSAPLWMVVGIGATARASREPEVSYPKTAWEDLRPLARFPQGMPPGMRKIFPQPHP